MEGASNIFVCKFAHNQNICIYLSDTNTQDMTILILIYLYVKDVLDTLDELENQWSE